MELDHNLIDTLVRNYGTPEAPPKPMGLIDNAAEVGRQGLGGLVVDAPKMIGGAMQALSPDQSAVHRAGESVEQYAKDHAETFAPNPNAGGFTRGLASGVRMLSGGAPILAAGMATGPVGAAVAGSALMGGSMAHEHYQDAKDAGASEDDARRAGALGGALGAATGGLGGAVAGRFINPLARTALSGGAAATAEGAIGAMSKAPGYISNLAKGVAGDAATFGAQSAGDQAINNAYGGQQGSVLDAALEGAKSGAIAGGVGGATLGARATFQERKLAGQVKNAADALQNPTMDKATFDSHIEFMAQQLQAKGVAPEVVDDWTAKINAVRQQAIWDATQPKDMLKIGYTPAQPEEKAPLISTPDGQVATDADAAFAHGVQPQPALPGAWDGEQPMHEWLHDKLKQQPVPTATGAEADQLLNRAPEFGPGELRKAPLPQEPAPAPTVNEVPPGQRTPMQGAVNDLLNQKDKPLPNSLASKEAWMNNPDMARQAMKVQLDRLQNAHVLDQQEAAAKQAQAALNDRATNAGIKGEAATKIFGSLEPLRDNGLMKPGEFADAVSLLADKKAAAYGTLKKQIKEIAEQAKGASDGRPGVVSAGAGQSGAVASPDPAGSVRPDDVRGADTQRPGTGVSDAVRPADGAPAVLADGAGQRAAPVGISGVHDAIKGYKQKTGTEKMQAAMRHLFGLDGEGNQVGQPASLAEAAAKVGYKNHAGLSRALKGLGLQEPVRDKALAAGGVGAGSEGMAAEAGLSTQKGATQTQDERSLKTAPGQSESPQTLYNTGQFHKLTDDQFQEATVRLAEKLKRDPGNQDARTLFKQAEAHARQRVMDEAHSEDAAAEHADENGKEFEDYHLTYDEDGSPVYSSQGATWTTEEEMQHKQDVVDDLKAGLRDGTVKDIDGTLVDHFLLDHPAYKAAMANLDAQGLGGFRKQLAAVTMHDLNGQADAVAWRLSNGRTVVVIDATRATTPRRSSQVLDDIHHEFGHAVVDALKLNGTADMDRVSDELTELYWANKEMQRMLQYPMAVEKMLPAVRAEELFAQAWKMYSKPNYKAFLEQVAPRTFETLEQLSDDLRQQFSSAASGRKSAGGRDAAADGADAGKEAGPSQRSPAAEAATPGAASDTGKPVSGEDHPAGSGAAVRQDQAAAAQARPGNLTPGDEPTRASRTIDPNRPSDPETIKAIRDEVARLTPEPVKSAASKLGDLWEKVAPRLLTPEQIMQRFKDRLQSLPQLHFLREAFIAETNRIQDKAANTIAAMGRLDHGTQQKTYGVMHDATMWRMHPDQKFGEGDNAHLGESSRALHAQLASRYAALPDKAKAVYAQALELGKNMQAEHSQVVKEALSRSTQNAMVRAADKGKFADMQGMADKLQKHLDAADAENKGPYFPLTRHGDYIAIGESKQLRALKDAAAKDPGNKELEGKIDELERSAGHYIISAHESKRERDQAMGQYAARGMQTRSLLQGDAVKGMARNLEPLRHLFEVNFDKETAAHLNNLLDAHYANSLSANHALSRQLERRNIAGADKNMRRNLAEMTMKEARYIAGQRFNQQIDAAMQQVSNEAKGNDQWTRVAQTLQKSIQLDRNPVSSPIENALTGLTHIWEIGISPARMIQYAAQPHMLSVPTLAGDFGFGKSFSAMNTAAADAFRLFKAAKAPDGAWHGSHGLDLTSSLQGLKPGEMELLRRMQQTSQMERGMHTDLNVGMETHEGPVGKAIETLHHVEAWALGHIDTAARVSTALAAYRLHMGKYGDHTKAMQFAQDHTKLTNFEYGQHAAPLAMRTGGGVPLARLFFQFRRYQQGCLNLLLTQGEKAFKGDKGATKSLGILLATHALIGGAMGIPLAQTAMGAANLFHKDDDPSGDIPTQLRQALYEQFGNDVGQAMMDGITAPLGLNMSQQLGMGSVLTDDRLMPSGFGRMYDAKNRDKVPAMALGILGPTGGFLERLATARQYAQQGDYMKMMEETLPETFAEALKAYRFGTQGVTDTKGHVAIKPEDMNVGHLAATAMGFHTEKEALYHEENASKSEIETSTKTKRDLLTQRFAKAMVHGEGTSSVMDAVNDFNERHSGPGSQGRLSMSDLLKATQQFRRSELFRGASGVGYDPRRERQLVPLATMEN